MLRFVFVGGDNTTTTHQQHSDRLRLEHNYPNYNRGGGIRFALCIEVEEGGKFHQLNEKLL